MPWASRWTGLAGASASASEWARMVNGRPRHPAAQRSARAEPRRASLVRLGAAAEEARDRAVLEDLLDRRADERGDREHRDAVDLLLGRDREGVGDDDL